MLREYLVFLVRFSNGTFKHFCAFSFESALYDIAYYLTELEEPEVELISIELDTEVSPVLIYKKQ